MLYRFIIDNYRSFGETTQFDMFPNPKRENMKDHVYMNNGVQLLKMAALYGANGAGKSNLLKALSFLKTLCTEMNAHPQKEWYKSWYFKNRFRLPPRSNDEPISMLIEFSTQSDTFLYNVEITPDGISKEELSISGLGEKDNMPIYIRDKSHVAFSRINIPEAISELFDRQLDSLPGSSVLAINSMLQFVKSKYLNDVYHWLRFDFVVIGADNSIPHIIDLYFRDKNLINFTSDIMAKIDVGIQSMRMENKPFEEWLNSLDESERANMLRSFPEGNINTFIRVEENRPSFFVHDEAGRRIVSEIMFRQMGANGYTDDMDIQTQSDGTVRLFALLPYIYWAIKRDMCIIVDELNRSIHPHLTRELVRFFGNQQTNGQLIFTTHEDYLLDQRELLRPDEVWMLDKKDAITRLYSLNSFKLHKTLSVQNGYMEGRYGGVPDLDINND